MPQVSAGVTFRDGEAGVGAGAGAAMTLVKVRIWIPRTPRSLCQEPSSRREVAFVSRPTVESQALATWIRFVRRFRRYAKDANVEDRYQQVHQPGTPTLRSCCPPGVPPHWVSRWLGHADTRITEWVSAHWIPRLDEHPVDELLEKGGTFSSLTKPRGAAQIV